MRGGVWFDNWAPFDLTPGMFVTLIGGSFTRTLQVKTFAITSFDPDTGIASDTVPSSGCEVGVVVNGPGIELWQVITSVDGGAWNVDFSLAEGVDLTFVEDIHVMIWDGDDDATKANFNFPLPE